MLITHLHLMSMSRMCRALSPYSLAVHTKEQKNVIFTYTNNFVYKHRPLSLLTLFTNPPRGPTISVSAFLFFSPLILTT